MSPHHFPCLLPPPGTFRGWHLYFLFRFLNLLYWQILKSIVCSGTCGRLISLLIGSSTPAACRLYCGCWLMEFPASLFSAGSTQGSLHWYLKWPDWLQFQPQLSAHFFPGNSLLFVLGCLWLFAASVNFRRAGIICIICLSTVCTACISPNPPPHR